MSDLRAATAPTAQEIFDYVFAAIIAQGGPSVVGEPGTQSCQYQSPDGRRCAVGVLLNDAELASVANYQQSPINALLNDYNSQLRPWFKEHESMLYRMQRAHDSAAYDGEFFIESFTRNMRVIGRDFDLETP